MTLQTWKHVSQSEIDDWREKARNDVATKRGTRLEYNTAYHTNIPQGTAEEARTGTATMSAQTAAGIRQHRDTVEESARSMISWVQDSKDQFMHRVRMLKRAGNFTHLTDEEAASQLWEICRKLAEDSAKRVYSRDGYDDRFWKEGVS